MSYDLYVFDPSAVPQDADADAFEEWLEETEEASEYAFVSENCTERLVAFYSDLITKLRPLNGPDAAPDDADPATVGDYSLFPTLIEMSFTWSASDTTAPLVFELAEKYGIGLYDPQDDQRYLPSERTGKLVPVKTGKLP